MGPFKMQFKMPELMAYIGQLLNQKIFQSKNKGKRGHFRVLLL